MVHTPDENNERAKELAAGLSSELLGKLSGEPPYITTLKSIIKEYGPIYTTKYGEELSLKDMAGNLRQDASLTYAAADELLRPDTRATLRTVKDVERGEVSDNLRDITKLQAAAAVGEVKGMKPGTNQESLAKQLGDLYDQYKEHTDKELSTLKEENISKAADALKEQRRVAKITRHIGTY